MKIEHICPIEGAGFQKWEIPCGGIYLFISKYKNMHNTFCLCLPRETHHAIYFGLRIFFKWLEIARL
ncbi:hypothetical protein YA62_012255 [Agrobacterium sp. LC34]|uniref:Uncharacterized protein n=1 Tax=Agrobacterium tumefaciens TaxID=358 RepID=A0AAE6BQ04_AGRTU|nr:hypothetical protein CFBP6623_14735 [Agrobacterium tumefaciens]QCM01529.1 hypothetical protein CFBP6624_14355 [Agrobacterium tumefaciens]TKT60511.1 hypothetical protein YA62_012255 [Agrobacterium sp. LC34]